MGAIVLVVMALQLSCLCLVKTRIHGPFKALTGYSFFVICLRYFYVDFGLSTFNITAEALSTTLLVLAGATAIISVVALLFEINEQPSRRQDFYLEESAVDTRAANLFFYISVVSFLCVFYVRFVKFGYVIQQDPSVDVWAGLYVLKVPMTACVISTIYNMHLKRHTYTIIGYAQLILMSLMDGERSVIFYSLVSLLLYLWVTRKISWKSLLGLVCIFPLIFYWLTLRRFSDLAFLEILLASWDILDADTLRSILQESYGRYYQVEATALMFDTSNHLREQYYNGLYLVQNLIPYFDFGEPDVSLTRLVCRSIDVGRWDDHVSCWGYFPAVMYFDSGLLGLFIALTGLVYLLYFWVKGAYSQRILIFAGYALIFPKLLFTLNFTLASFFELAYYGLYFMFVLAIAKVNCRQAFASVRDKQFMQR
ncbi:hypothetical protein N9Y62_03270 [Luminiphilus sp.]|nr:hypothetical protein [Luminiphilus sp.]